MCRLLAEGFIDKQVAAVLGTKPSTVQIQRTRAFDKLGVTSAVEMYRVMLLADDRES